MDQEKYLEESLQNVLQWFGLLKQTIYILIK